MHQNLFLLFGTTHQRTTNPVTVDNEWAQSITLGRSHVLAAYIELRHGVTCRRRRRRKQMMVIGDRRDTLTTLRS